MCRNNDQIGRNKDQIVPNKSQIRPNKQNFKKFEKMKNVRVSRLQNNDEE